MASATQDSYDAVLRLANAGALAHALAEYDRLGLGAVRDHEDTMALRGRLLKDASRTRSGGDARDLARQSAAAYQRAYDATGGFYSGINAATLSLLAGEDPAVVRQRATRILKALPASEGLDPAIKYFIEATRAEAHLLLGRPADAETAIEIARAHDPLNFAAHASTLRQFGLIAQALGSRWPWLETLRPPRAAHYCGPLRLGDAEDSLRTGIGETLQAQDIGFGFGALAAGADILCAETLLGEGAEVHLFLPVDPDQFRSVSVTPFGEDWDARFRHCLAAASSLTVSEGVTGWYDATADRNATIAAMGAAVRQSWRLLSDSVQLKVAGPDNRGAATALNTAIWAANDRAIHLVGQAGAPDMPVAAPAALRFMIQPEDGARIAGVGLAELSSRLDELAQDEDESRRIVLGATCGSDPDADLRDRLVRLLDAAPRGGVYAERLAADLISIGLPGVLVASELDWAGLDVDAFAVQRVGQAPAFLSS